MQHRAQRCAGSHVCSVKSVGDVNYTSNPSILKRSLQSESLTRVHPGNDASGSITQKSVGDVLVGFGLNA